MPQEPGVRGGGGRGGGGLCEHSTKEKEDFVLIQAMQLKCQSRTQSPQALWPAVSQQEPLPKEPEDSG